MDWMPPFGFISDRPLPDAGVPHRLLRHVFAECGIGIGNRVLVVGCGTGDLLRFFDALCLEASGLDESLDDVRELAKRSPHLTCRCGSPRQQLPFPQHHFNLVLALEVPTYKTDLFGVDALCATARLLAAVRPGGTLCLLGSNAADSGAPRNEPKRHADECYHQHLTTFAAGARVSHVGESWNWLARFLRRPSYLTASLHVPVEPHSLNDWLRIGLQSARRRKSACCPAADVAAPITASSRRAA